MCFTSCEIYNQNLNITETAMQDEFYESQPTNSDQGDYSMEEKDYINFTPP